MSGPSTLAAGGGMLPAGRYKLEIHRVGPLAAEVALATPCYVLQATPYVQPRPSRVAVAPTGDRAVGPDDSWHVMLVLAIPVEAT